MPRAQKEAEIYRREETTNFAHLNKEEREKLIAPYLPAPPPPKQHRKSKLLAQARASSSISQRPSLFGIHELLNHALHVFVYYAIHSIFSLYIRFRIFYHAIVDRVYAILYYHHRTPELIRKDVRGLKKLPEHLSVVLRLDERSSNGSGLEMLVDEVAELSAWCACVGIPILSVYEETGMFLSSSARCESVHDSKEEKRHQTISRKSKTCGQQTHSPS